MFHKRSSTLRAILFALIVSLLTVDAGLDREPGCTPGIAKRPPAGNAAVENQFGDVALLPIVRAASGSDAGEALWGETNAGILYTIHPSADGLSVPADSTGSRPPRLPTPPRPAP